jgi:hypothetical protein
MNTAKGTTRWAGRSAAAIALGLVLAAGAAAVEGKAGKPDKAPQVPSALAKALNRNPQNVTLTQWADGTVAADLGGQYMNVWIARVNADGSLSQACVTSADEASNALAGQPTLEVK